MESIVRALLHLRSPKQPKDNIQHVVRSNSFTVQLNPSFFQNRTTCDNTGPSPKPPPVAVKDKPIISVNRQNVRYISSERLQNSHRPTCLKMLQEPLRDVYLSFVDKAGAVPCVIDVLDNGIHVQYAKQDGTDIVEMMNEFHTIAYWAAIRCVVLNSSQNVSNSCSGVQIGFFPFTEGGQCVVQEYSTEGFLHVDDIDNSNLLRMDHPPLFACVMRDAFSSSSSALQCHLFLCSTSQQAITLASKLYENLKFNLNEKLKFQQLQQNTETSLQEHFPALNDNKNSVNSHRKYATTVICSNCKRKSKANSGSRRSTSFSQFLSRLRRLAVSKESETPISGASLRRRNNNKPVLNRWKATGDVETAQQTDDSDAGYHSIPQQVEHKPKLIKLPVTTPPWSSQQQVMRCGLSSSKSDGLIGNYQRSTQVLGEVFNEHNSDSGFFRRNLLTSSFGGAQVSVADAGIYAEIEEPDVNSSTECSVVMEANLSSSEDEDELAERDSLESCSSWERPGGTAVSRGQRQVETINQMLSLAAKSLVSNRARSLSDLFAKESPDNNRLSVDVSRLIYSGEAQSKLGGHYVTKDAEIVSVLQQINHRANGSKHFDGMLNETPCHGNVAKPQQMADDFQLNDLQRKSLVADYQHARLLADNIFI